MKIQVRASAVVVIKKKVLLCRRSQDKKHFPDSWSIPGGELTNPGESFTKFLAHRIKDQLGLSFIPEQKLWFYETISNKIHAITHIYIGKIEGNSDNIVVNKKHHSEFGWFAYEDMSDLDLAFSDWEVIEDLSVEGLI